MSPKPLILNMQGGSRRGWRGGGERLTGAGAKIRGERQTSGSRGRGKVPKPQTLNPKP